MKVMPTVTEHLMVYQTIHFTCWIISCLLKLNIISNYLLLVQWYSIGVITANDHSKLTWTKLRIQFSTKLKQFSLRAKLHNLPFFENVHHYTWSKCIIVLQYEKYDFSVHWSITECNMSKTSRVAKWKSCRLSQSIWWSIKPSAL